MMEYMTALMQQAKRLDERSQSRSMSHSSLKLSGGEGLPRLIVPLVIDEIFETRSKASGGNLTSMAAESMLLHPIGDNQISTTTLRTHDQIMRSDLDFQGKGGVTSGFAGATGQTTVSGVVDAILDQCATDEARGGTQVFTVQCDRWGRYDAAAKHVVVQLRSIGSSHRPVQSQSTREGGANAGSARRILGTPSSLHAGKSSSLQDEPLPSLLAPLLHQHLTQSDSTSDETQFHSAGMGSSFTTDSTTMSASSGTISDRRAAGDSADAATGSSRHKGQPSSRREFSSGTSKTDTSIASSSARSVYHSTETTSVRGFRTATAGSTASLNGSEGNDGRSITNSVSMWSFVTAEEMEEVKEEEEEEAAAHR
jgi:hypothetical protein